MKQSHTAQSHHVAPLLLLEVMLDQSTGRIWRRSTEFNSYTTRKLLVIWCHLNMQALHYSVNQVKGVHNTFLSVFSFSAWGSVSSSDTCQSQELHCLTGVKIITFSTISLCVFKISPSAVSLCMTFFVLLCLTWRIEIYCRVQLHSNEIN